ncbi:MAG: hypothetical protein A2289_12505 [Deltaproteobacteria bacterium RIFOXYA12_FULL_58_15]|nr:MAG: hypothetical protein A2289_12505 [Deltaproteobacteria bacterium RIFOXYA12_FULL_58_15]OGR13871.1 MAG: hypothetical protein A2341_25775 [Deltaproteobacteria bacterium RIFOXYB12_FULL_58_9]
MKSTLYAAVAACLAMLATSGIVVYATAAPDPRETAIAEVESQVSIQIDLAIAHQLAEVKQRLEVAVLD